MTIKKAIALAKQTIMEDMAYIEHIKKYDKEHPYPFEDKLGCRISELVITIVMNEINLLFMLITEIKPKPRAKSKKSS